MRPILALAITALLAASAPSVRAESIVPDVDIADTVGDVLARGANARQAFTDFPAYDIVRVRGSVDGDELVHEIEFGAPPASVDVFVRTQLGDGERVEFRLTLDASGQPMHTTNGMVAGSVNAIEPAEVERTGSVVTVRFPREHLPEIACFLPEVSTSEAGPSEDKQDHAMLFTGACAEGARLDGTQSDGCPAAPAPSGRDPIAFSLTDPRGDVRMRTIFGADRGAATEPTADIIRFSSAREGARVVQTVELAAVPSDDFSLQIVNHVDGWVESLDGSLPDAPGLHVTLTGAGGSGSDATLVAPTGEIQSAEGGVWFRVERPRADAFTFSWCASLIPVDALCFAPRVVMRIDPLEPESPGDELRPSPDPCAGKADTRSGAEAGEEGDGPIGEEGGEEAADDENADPSPREDEEPAPTPTDTPGLGAVLTLAALVLLALARRRRS